MLTLQPTVIAADNPEKRAGSKTRLQNNSDANPAMQSAEPVERNLAISDIGADSGRLAPNGSRAMR